MGLNSVKDVNFELDSENKFNSGFGEVICSDHREVVKFLPYNSYIKFQDLVFPFIGIEIKDPALSKQNMLLLENLTPMNSMSQVYGSCSHFGKILSCLLLTLPEGHPLGSAEIIYSTIEEAQTAMVCLND